MTLYLEVIDDNTPLITYLSCLASPTDSSFYSNGMCSPANVDILQLPI